MWHTSELHMATLVCTEMIWQLDCDKEVLDEIVIPSSDTQGSP
jgi:hypothetical protein